MGRSTFSDLVNPTHEPLNHRGQYTEKKSVRLVKGKWSSGVSLIFYVWRSSPFRKTIPPTCAEASSFSLASRLFFLHASACGRRIYAIFIFLLFSLWARNPFPRSEVDNRRGQVNCGSVRGRSAHESPGMIRKKKIELEKTDRIVTAVSFGKGWEKKFLEIIIFTKY